MKETTSERNLFMTYLGSLSRQGLFQKQEAAVNKEW